MPIGINFHRPTSIHPIISPQYGPHNGFDIAFFSYSEINR